MNANLLGHLLWRSNGGLIYKFDMTNPLFKLVIHRNVNYVGISINQCDATNPLGKSVTSLHLCLFA